MSDESESITTDTYYVLGSGDPAPEKPHGSDWPKELRIPFEARKKWVWQGKEHVALSSPRNTDQAFESEASGPDQTAGGTVRMTVWLTTESRLSVHGHVRVRRRAGRTHRRPVAHRQAS